MKKFFKASFFQKIVLPAMLAILLFIISVFFFIIPTFENNAMSEKKIMLHELTNTAWSILNKYHNDEVKGLITAEEAQKQAISQIEALRYGADKKDYFWITDLRPIMVMHPYVHELNGKSLQDFADPDGKKLFMEALKLAQSEGEGFINYKWQQNDDTTHIVPKLSFVKKFTPWNWIIGTGIYLQDVEQEISSLTNKLLLILFVITIIITLMVFFITYQSLRIEKSRLTIEEQLRESREKYKSLLESSTEGIILLLNTKISYTNSFIQNWLEYSATELMNLEIHELFSNEQSLDFENVKNETRHEIALIKKDGTTAEAILTLLPIRFADKEGLLLTLHDTSENRTVKMELEDLKTRFQNFSRHSGLGLFRFSLKGEGRFIEFNQKVISILGYNNESELKNVALADILANKSDLKKLLSDLMRKRMVSTRLINLKRKDNVVVEIKLSLILTTNSSGELVFCDGIIEPAETKVLDENPSHYSTDFASVFARNRETVIDYCSPVITCPVDATLSLAIEIMNRNKSSFILVTLNDKCIGILTWQDIVTRVLKDGIDMNSLVSGFMTAPVVFVFESTQVEDAAVLMEWNKISYLVVKNMNGELIGVLDKKNLLGIYINPNDFISGVLKNWATISNLATCRKLVPFLIKPLLNEIGSVQTICKIISKFNDSITQSIIQNAIKELGQPPVPFAFITIGSDGREELALNSDQDNAIIYDDNLEIPTEELQDYFRKLSARICSQLDESGLPFCKGGYMANNPKWCQPLRVWKEYFNEWIVNAEPVNILNISVFFDLRVVFGDTRLFKNLEDYVFDVLQGRSAFFYFLAQSVISFKPPINVFGNIVTETTSKHSEAIDIKNCNAQVIVFARIYALHNNIKLKGTIERINALRAIEMLSQSTCDELLFHFNFLMYQRIKHHVELISKKTEPDNYILPKRMTEMELVILKKIFSQMSGYQTKLSASFMSAYKG